MHLPDPRVNSFQRFYLCEQKWKVGIKSWRPENEDTKPKPDASDGTMTIAYMVFHEKEADYLEFQVCGEVSASQGTHNKGFVNWKYSWNRNRDQDLAISSTSCQRPLSSCPSLLFPKSPQ